MLTNGEAFSYDKNEIESYVVTGLKYVPVKVKLKIMKLLKQRYTVVENGSTLSGGFSEENLKNYTDLVAEVTENTNGLKTVTQNEDGSFSFVMRVNNGTDSESRTPIKNSREYYNNGKRGKRFLRRISSCRSDWGGLRCTWC